MKATSSSPMGRGQRGLLIESLAQMVQDLSAQKPSRNRRQGSHHRTQRTFLGASGPQPQLAQKGGAQESGQLELFGKGESAVSPPKPCLTLPIAGPNGVVGER